MESTRKQGSCCAGEKDSAAPAGLTEEYAAALRKHGITPSVNVLAGMGHNRIMFGSAVRNFRN